jgi:molybdopterin-guanine dinucleotide biosynthesis protein B
MRVIGIVGWSGAGKTTLLVKLIPALRAQGLRVSTIKRAHHAFDVDVPGKDSYEHRAAGAGEVLVTSDRRWALMHENETECEPDLAELLGRLSPTDIVLVEGFKWAEMPKIEVHRAANGKPYLYPEDADVVAVLTDAPMPGGQCPHAGLDDIPAACALVDDLAMPLDDIAARLRAASRR